MTERSRPTPIGDVMRSLLDRSHRLNPTDLIRVAAEEAATAGFDNVVVYLVDRQQQALSAFPPDGEWIPIEGTVAGDVYRRERVKVVDDDSGARRAWVPMRVGQDRLGVLAAIVPDESDDTIADLCSLTALVAEIITAKNSYSDVFECARRTQDMQLAAEMRYSTLPPLTMRAPNVSVAGILEPAYEIAGDTFDYALNGRVAHFAIFDAVGHGLGAARLANLTLGTYRNRRRGGEDLAHTAAAIDETLLSQFGQSWFVTTLLAQLDLDTGELRWVNAGHVRPLLLRNGRVISELESKPAPPLGLGRTPPVPMTYQLQPEDSVLLYSDGVTEARSPEGEHFEVERLRETVARALGSGVSPAETLRRCVSAVLEYSVKPIRDDATLLLVTWTRD